MLQKPPLLAGEKWAKIIAARREKISRQSEAFPKEEIWQESVRSKLLAVAHATDPAIECEKWFQNFMRCGIDTGFVLCASCGHGKSAPYRCSLKWCPVCNWRISFRRKLLLEKITAGMPQLKHVVLTQKNFEHLTREKILESRKNLFDLRRQKVLDKKLHGCASCEITNEGNGWHLHWHILLTQKWIEADKLSIAWGKLVGQEFAIVKVKAVDGKDYLQEILKYVVKGSEFASWSEAQILEFIKALSRTQMFTTFGRFRKIAKHARSVVASEKLPCTCKDCGGVSLIYGKSENDCQNLLEKGYF